MHRILNVLFSKTNKGEICNAIMVDEAIDLIFHEGKAGETYNVGGRNERSNARESKRRNWK